MAKRSTRAALDISQALASVDETLRRGHPRDALNSLLKIWAEHRAPELAELIEALSSRLCAIYPALPTSNRRDFDEVWLQRLSTVDPAERGLLLERALEGPGPELCRRMEMLAALPPDPRVASVALRGVLHWQGSARNKAWTAMHRVLRAHADPRTITALERNERGFDDANPHYDHWRLRGGKNRTLSMVRKVLAKLAIALAGEDRTAVEALAQRIETRVGDLGLQLLTEIYANPEDLDRRRVYADWLGQRGEPRGEFITLQLLEADGDPRANDPKVRRRIARLRGAREAQWLGRLATAFVPGTVQFVAGFPVCGQLRPKLRNLGLFVDAPEWATFTSFTRPPVQLLRSSSLASGIEVRDDENRAARLLAVRRPIPRVRRLIVDSPANFMRYDRRPRLWDIRERGLTELREISLIYEKPVARLGPGLDSWADRLASPVLDGLEQLEIVQPIGAPPEVAWWVETLRSSRCRTISRLRLRVAGLLFDIEGADGEWTRVHVHGCVDEATQALLEGELSSLAALGGGLELTVAIAGVPQR